MKKNSEIRQEALSTMKGNWGVGITILFVTGVINYFCSLLFYGIPSIFIGYPLTLGLAIAYLLLVRGEQKLEVGTIFAGFKSHFYWKSIGTTLLVGIYTFLWTLLLFIPGIIKSLSYSLTLYILADEPELSVNQAIEKSMKMMEGHKMQLFLMILGYMGYAILSIIALGIPLLWLVPYYNAVLAKFYEEVKSNYQAVA